ncbi:MAG: hypothetical protein ACWGOL_08585, partial [Desulfuromonadales bacterium]
MKKTNYFCWTVIVLLAAFLGACGDSGNGSGDSSSAALTSVTMGVAADPYIVGAIVEEISADGQHVQFSDGPTNQQGEFTFPDPVMEDSTIRLKPGAEGMHGNAPYTGKLKRKVTMIDGSSVALTPLTTLAANGMSSSEIIKMMSDAGLPDLTEEDIYADPVVGLEDLTSGVNDAMLRNLQANMAANGYMTVLDNFDYHGQAPSGVSVHLNDLVKAVQQTLNADLYSQLAAEIGSGFNLGDLVNTAAQLNNTIVSQIRQEMASGNQTLPANRVDEIVSNAMADTSTIAMNVSQVRNNNDGVPTPPPVSPPTTEPLTGEGLYVDFCQSCHGSLQTSKISNRTADGIQAAINGNAGGMGSILLTSEEIQLIAAALPIPQPPVEPPASYRNGQAVYEQECSGCHKLATHDPAGNIDLAGKGATIVPKIEGGHMGKSLPTQELSALADFADTFATPAPPVVPRGSQAVYDQECSGCHKLNGYDADGNIDLAGKGNIAATKIPTGHGGNVSTEELTTLAAWLDSWAPAPPPVVDRTGQEVYDGVCAGCHKLYGYDANGNIDLASMGSTVTTKLATGHGGTVSAGEISNVATWLDSWAPAPPPV